VTREEPRRWDWWLAGCAALAAILIAVDVAAVVSDAAAERPVSAPRTQTTTPSSSGEAAAHGSSSGVPISYSGSTSTGECRDVVARVSSLGLYDDSAASASRVWTWVLRSGPC
jgi:hypothetical protein